MSPNPTAKHLIITVQFGRSDQTDLLLASLANTSAVQRGQVDVVIVNTGAVDFPDGPTPALERYATLRAKLINSANLGYFGGANLGLQSVVPDEYDWIIVTNNDIQFEIDFFDRLNTTHIPANFVIAPRIIGSDGIDQNPQYVHPIPLFKRLFFMVLFAMPPRIGLTIFWWLARRLGQRGLAGRAFDRDKPSEIWLPLGAIFILPRALISRLGQLPTDSLLYGEEMLLKRDLHRAGGAFLMDPLLKVYHAESSTTSKLDDLVKWRLKRSAFFKCWRFYMFENY